jgi:hypothetical protein
MSDAAAWRAKLLDEGRLLAAVGLLADDGEVRCRDCGGRVEREDGWAMRFVCPCGWSIEDDSSLGCEAA